MNGPKINGIIKFHRAHADKTASLIIHGLNTAILSVNHNSTPACSLVGNGGNNNHNSIGS